MRNDQNDARRRGISRESGLISVMGGAKGGDVMSPISHHCSSTTNYQPPTPHEKPRIRHQQS